MGNCTAKVDNYDPAKTSRNNFAQINVIGRGNYGKVWKIEMRKNRQQYAMKEMLKSKIFTTRSVNSIMNERKLLSQLRHPFIVNIAYAFQDREKLFLVTDLLTGGDLRYNLIKKKRFNEQQTKFIVACVVLGLEYIHFNGVIHRDIKPENLIFDNKGYVRITDFGISRIITDNNAQDISGTPGYMAPEVMSRQNHGVAVDYFSLGVIAYECMLGKRPYNGKTRKEIREQIMTKQVQLKKHEIPEGWSLESADFINKCMQRKQTIRLGFNGPAEVKQHLWLKSYDWTELAAKKIIAPYIPSTAKAVEISKRYLKLREENIAANGETQWDDNDYKKQNYLLLNRNSVQCLFAGYFYDADDQTTTPEENEAMAKMRKVVHL